MQVRSLSTLLRLHDFLIYRRSQISVGRLGPSGSSRLLLLEIGYHMEAPVFLDGVGETWISRPERCSRETDARASICLFFFFWLSLKMLHEQLLDAQCQLHYYLSFFSRCEVFTDSEV